ncbi:hypothetical protein ACQXVK_10170 [Curtobacterium sp. AB451]|uniref:hypothetical protein n=1 Tax=Curtobacterium sp. AB451 TaxID=3422306 RepID=UPI003D34760C
MNTTRTTTRNRRRDARSAARTITTRLRAEARRQGTGVIRLHQKTGLDRLATLRIWFGINPSAWSIERCREVLGLSIEQVWEVR